MFPRDVTITLVVDGLTLDSGSVSYSADDCTKGHSDYHFIAIQNKSASWYGELAQSAVAAGFQLWRYFEG